jgi:hypothetical protein
MARSRKPLLVVASAAFGSAWACLAVSQFPKRTPLGATPLTRVMPLASAAPAIRYQQLRRQLPNGRNPDIDGNGAQPTRLEGHPPSGHSCLGKAGPWLLGIPSEKLVQAQVGKHVS